MILRDEKTGEAFDVTPRMIAWLQVASGVDEVGADDHTDQKRYDSRAAMFKQVDRQIRARVAALMPDVLSAARVQIENTLGVESITEAVRQHRRQCSDRLAETRATFDSTIAGLVDDALASIAAHQIDELAQRCKRAIGTVVAKEVTRQLGRLLKVAVPAAAAPAARKARAR